MINHGKVQSTTRPENIEITSNKVFIATNVHTIQYGDLDDLKTCYEYTYVEYTKDEYLLQLIQQTEDTQMALCEVYEMLEGGLE